MASVHDETTTTDTHTHTHQSLDSHLLCVSLAVARQTLSKHWTMSKVINTRASRFLQRQSNETQTIACVWTNDNALEL